MSNQQVYEDKEYEKNLLSRVNVEDVVDNYHPNSETKIFAGKAIKECYVDEDMLLLLTEDNFLIKIVPEEGYDDGQRLNNGAVTVRDLNRLGVVTDDECRELFTKQQECRKQYDDYRIINSIKYYKDNYPKEFKEIANETEEQTTT